MRNGRPYAIKIAPAAVIAFAALAVGYGLGEQAQLGERDVQTVTQEVRQTGDVKRLCMTVNHGDMQPADGNHKRTFQSLEERGYTQDVGYGRYAITEAGRRALQKDLS